MSARPAHRRNRPLPQLAACQTCGYFHNASKCPKCGALPVEVPVKQRKAPRHFEDSHQAALFDWVRLAKAVDPDLGKLYHVPNGGARDPREGARLKAQGVRKGQLDLNLDVARGGWFGLRIELKATRAELGYTPEVTDHQLAIYTELQADGYRAEICHGWEEARDMLLDYVRRPLTQVQR